LKKDTKNFGFSHKSGILMPISSLPSPYGIGSLGQYARDFVDFLVKTEQTCWQILPINPTAYGDSPYQSPCSQAGNPYFIDLPQLQEKGLLTEEELLENRHDTQRVDYGWLWNTRFALLRKAFSRFVPDESYAAFCQKHSHWLNDYALFMALKERYGHSPWVTWAPEHKDADAARLLVSSFAPEMDFWKWVQFEFYTQWNALHQYATQNGISIIGDMPIYAAHDSVDVWRDREQFLLNSEGDPLVVAGFPPDGFSPDGQLWGNPIYNWKGMKKDGFAWWIRRIGCALELYDILRLDHFIGFENYYAVPYPSPNARGGSWQKAPGKALFKALKTALPGMKIIAEDLGIVTDEVRKLLKYTGFPGMKMLHFAFYEDDSENLPRMYNSDNWVVYTASHDSDCTASWAQAQSRETIKRLKQECPVKKGQTIPHALIAFAMSSRANLAMVPMQDYLELTNEQGRMNIPSVAQGNWSWRLDADYATAELIQKIHSFTTAHNRQRR
jgi:4-alpha-glucanotransferase